MNAKPLTIVTAVLAFSLVFTTASMLKLRVESQRLAQELQDSESELSAAQALREGVEEANEDLRKQVEQLRTLPPLTTRQEGSNFDQQLMGQELEDNTGEVSLTQRRRDQQNQDDQSETERTPEQIAEREQREQERQARREERDRRRQEYRERVSTELQMRRAFFSQMNLEGLNPDYLKAHQDLMAAIDTAEAGMAALQQEGMDRNERREIMRGLWQNAREMNGLMEMQRDVLLNDYAQEYLGLDQERTSGFIEYMQTVDEMTGSSFWRGGRGGGRGGR